MRTLTFEPEDSRYELLHAILVTGTPNRDRRAGKVHAETCDKFEAIGQAKPALDDAGNPRPFRDTDIRFFVTVSGGTLVLEDEAYDLLLARALAAIPTVMPHKSRDLERTLAWLEGLPKEEAQPAKALPAATE